MPPFIPRLALEAVQAQTRADLEAEDSYCSSYSSEEHYAHQNNSRDDRRNSRDDHQSNASTVPDHGETQSTPDLAIGK